MDQNDHVEDLEEALRHIVLILSDHTHRFDGIDRDEACVDIALEVLES